MITIDTALLGSLSIGSNQLISHTSQNKQKENEKQHCSIYFGFISSVRQVCGGSSVYISNDRGHEVMMSNEYEHVDSVAQRCMKAMDNKHEVNIVTSTHVIDWSNAQYFCDIEEI